jgi:hypothetical protein
MLSLVVRKLAAGLEKFSSTALQYAFDVCHYW